MTGRIECCVCLEVVKDSLILPCLHSVCSSCAQDMISLAKDENKPPKCVVCSTSFDEDITKLTLNTAHISTSSTRSDEQDAINESFRCPRHAMFQIHGFCDRCDDLYCEACVHPVHEHDLTDLDGNRARAFSECISRIETAATELQLRRSCLDEAIKNLSSLSDAFRARQTLLSEQITEVFESLIKNLTQPVGTTQPLLLYFFNFFNFFKIFSGSSSESVDVEQLKNQRSLDLSTRLNALLKEVSETLKSEMKAADMQQNELISIKEQYDIVLEQSATMTQIHTTSGFVSFSLYALVRARMQLHLANMPVLEPVVRDSLRFVLPSDIDIWQIPTSKLGSLGRFRDYSAITMPQHTYNHTKNVGNRTMANIIVAYNGEVSIVEHSNATQTQEAKRGVWGSITAIDGSKIETTTKGEIWALNESGVKWISKADGKVSLFGCRGVCATPFGEVVACDEANNRLVVLSLSDGKFLRCIGQGSLRGPHSIVCTNLGELIVLETAGHRVSVWNLKGERICSWGSYGHNLGEFDTPVGLGMLQDCRVVVSEFFSGRIQIF